MNFARLFAICPVLFVSVAQAKLEFQCESQFVPSNFDIRISTEENEKKYLDLTYSSKYNFTWPPEFVGTTTLQIPDITHDWWQSQVDRGVVILHFPGNDGVVNGWSPKTGLLSIVREGSSTKWTGSISSKDGNVMDLVCTRL